MSLRRTKEILNIDQQNILMCEVIDDLDTATTVRTPKGQIVRAGKPAGVTFEKGSLVEVRTDKRVYTVVGDSTYAEFSAERSFLL
jgi:hypothetical protein